MTETMLERMCSAIAEVPASQAYDVGSRLTEAAIERIAKAALQAIREPSEGMIVTASHAESIVIDDETRQIVDFLPSPVWTAMIDHILNEGEE